MEKLLEYLKKLIDPKFYGKVIINFEAGRIVRFEKRITEDVKQFK